MKRKSKTISIDGETYEVREMTFGAAMKCHRCHKEGDPQGALPIAIADCVYTAKGEPLKTSADEANQLPSSFVAKLAPALEEAIAELNGDLAAGNAPGKSKAKGSRRKSA